MLAPRYVVFTALEGSLLDPQSLSWSATGEALDELERRHIPLVLVSQGTRAQLEPLRGKLQHAHPFITESGGGLFLPDGYFSLRLEGAVRAARYFCVPFGQPYAEVTAALEEIAAQVGADVVGYSRMTAREIARNTGETTRVAELARQREFSERFFFAGATEDAMRRFEEAAHREHWEAVRGNPFWEFRSVASNDRALRYLMRLYRSAAPRTRLTSVAIGSMASDLSLLSAADSVILIPRPGMGFDATLATAFPAATHAPCPGPAGWGQAVTKLLWET